MRKSYLLLLPLMTLALASCANNNGVNFISVGEAIEIAKENFDPHAGDGYNTEYLFKTNNSKISEASVYQKHYFDPSSQTGEYTIDKIYDLDLDLSGLEGILYYSRAISFTSTDLLEFHEAVETVASTVGYINNGFIKVNNHLGYYINSNYFTAVTTVIKSLLELFESIFTPESEILTLLLGLIDGFTADQATFTFAVTLTRYGFIDDVNIDMKVDRTWFDFSLAGSLPQWFFGDFMSIDYVNLDLDLKCSYSL